VKVGSHIVEEPIWKEYNYEELGAGTYEVKLEGEKKSIRAVDWIVKSQGVWIDEWALWYGMYETNLTSAYTFEESSGDLIDYWSGYNGTVNGATTQVAGINSYGYNFDGNDYIVVGNEAVHQGSMTISTWANITSASGNQVLLEKGWDGDGGFKLATYGTRRFSCFLKDNGGSHIWALTTNTYTLGEWIHVACVIDTSTRTAKIYVNGILEDTSSEAGNNILGDTSNIGIGGLSSGGGEYLTGRMDELYIWNAVKDDTFIGNLFDGGTGTFFYVDYIVTLNSPADNYTSANSEIIFNATATFTRTTLVNISLWNNKSGWSLKETQTKTGITNTSIFTYDFVDDGSYIWGVESCNSDGDCEFASENRTVNVDTVAPQVTLSPSSYDYHQLGTNLTVNFTITDTNLQACWFDYGGTNYTVGCAGGNLSTNITTYLNKSLIFYANDSAGNLNTTYHSWDYKVFANSLTYNPTAHTTSSESFVLNITYDSGTYNLGGHKLIYNGTEFPVSFQGTGDNRLLNATITIPSPIGTKTFWFNFTIDGTEVSTSSSTQSVSDPTPITVSSTTCGAGLTPAFYFDFANAVDRGVLNASVNYNFQYGYAGNTTGLLSYGNLTDVFNFSICINATNPSYSVGYGEVQYEQTNYRLRHFYIFENTRLTNTTINNTLYLIPTASTYEFNFLVQDNLVKEQTDKYVSLLRWYPEINQYKVVEMGNTDENGETVFSLITGTVDYRVGIYEKDGTLIHLTTPSRFVCSASPCTHTVTVPSSPTSLFDISGIQNSLTFNTTSKIFTFIWNDPSQATTGMNLSVYRDTYGNNVVICSEQAETWTGILTCDVSAYTGSLRAVVYRSASPYTEFNSLIAKIGGEISSIAGGKTIGLFLGLVLFVFAVLMGIFSPVVAILMGFVSLIPMLYFGAIGRTTFIGIILLGGIIIHFLRRS